MSYVLLFVVIIGFLVVGGWLEDRAERKREEYFRRRLTEVSANTTANQTAE
jgi:hypothetical protein